MCVALGTVLTVGSAIMGGYSAYQQQKSANKAAEYNAQINERNAEIAEMQAKDAESRGVEEERTFRKKLGRLKSSQRAAFAGAGVQLGSGSAYDVLQGTDLEGDVDAMTIRANTAKEAWGYRTQSGNYIAQSRLSRTKKGSAGLSGFTTLLTGLSPLARKYGG